MSFTELNAVEHFIIHQLNGEHNNKSITLSHIAIHDKHILHLVYK